MAKVPYTVDVDVFICSELEDIRNMIKTHDYSGLAATVERIQFHASRMETGLYHHKDFIYDIQRKIRPYLNGDKEKSNPIPGFSDKALVVKDKSGKKLAKSVDKMIREHFKG